MDGVGEEPKNTTSKKALSSIKHLILSAANISQLAKAGRGAQKNLGERLREHSNI